MTKSCGLIFIRGTSSMRQESDQGYWRWAIALSLSLFITFFIFHIFPRDFNSSIANSLEQYLANPDKYSVLPVDVLPSVSLLDAFLADDDDDDVDNNRLTSDSDDGTFDDYETSEDELSDSDEIESGEDD